MMGAPGRSRRLVAVPDGDTASGRTPIGGGTTVAGLAASSGALLRPVHLPVPEAPITNVEIYDSTRAHDFTREALLLGVGLDPASTQASSVIARAAEQG